jgi:HEAT repeat protein
MAAVAGAPLTHAVEDVTQESRYKLFVQELNTEQFALDYPKALKNLDSNNSETQVTGLMTASATGELAAIPFIADLLESKDRHVRICAGVALEQLVSRHVLKRRDWDQPTKVAIKPLGDNDTDLRSLAWVINKMLRKPDDGNTHAYAATMIGYLDLKEFGPQLKQLSASPHPAVKNSAKYALEVMKNTSAR